MEQRLALCVRICVTQPLSEYEYDIQRRTSVGLLVMLHNEIITIYFSEPGAVRNFTISQPPDTAQRLDLIVICPEERERNGPITKFTYNISVDGDTPVS